MLKKILYNKYNIENIDENILPLSSEEFLKILFDRKNVIMFEFKKNALRLLPYTGSTPDFLGRATKFQPMAIAGSEVYKLQDLSTCVKYQENVLCNNAGFSDYSYVSEDIDNYINILNALDNCVLINSKQVFIPFIVKSSNSNNAAALKNLFTKIFGKDFQNLVFKTELTENVGATIETTNMQMFLDQIQNAKKKILDEAFFYLGVSSPQGKLTHQSELEISSANNVVDLLDKIMFDKINDFLQKCNAKFGLNMVLVKKF